MTKPKDPNNPNQAAQALQALRKNNYEKSREHIRKVNAAHIPKPCDCGNPDVKTGHSTKADVPSTSVDMKRNGERIRRRHKRRRRKSSGNRTEKERENKMGREVRRVPATWEHPKDYKGHYIPLYDRSYTAACKEWKEGYAAWESGEDSSRAKNPDVEYWDWNGMPPDKDTHCPEWTDAERTHYQMYETVSEGTPVSPVFATPKELARYLSDNGDFWYQMGGAYRMPNASYEGWLRVCNGGYAPSMVIHNGVLSSGVEALTQQGE